MAALTSRREHGRVTKADDLRFALAANRCVRVGFSHGDRSGLWGVYEINEPEHYVTFLVPITMGDTEPARRKVDMELIAWVEVSEIPWGPED